MIFTQSATADANDVHDIVPYGWTVLWILSEWSVPRIQQYREQSKKQLMNGRLDRDKFNRFLFFQLTDRLKEGGLGGGFENLLSGVKNLLPARRELIVSKIVADIMTPPQNEPSKADDYLYFDPKLSRSSRSPRQHKVTFQEAIVFVVGGGNYIEYQNLQEITTVREQRKSNFGTGLLKLILAK